MIDGYSVEYLFSKAAPKEWLFLCRANPQEDMFEHWDIKYLIDNKETTIDIKAHKAEYRNGPLLKDWFWVEFRNVRGKNGWLFGKADLIAFEYFGKFMIYDRKNLADRALELVDDTWLTHKVSEAHNKIYQRYNREDQISLVKISDLPIPIYSLII